MNNIVPENWIPTASKCVKEIYLRDWLAGMAMQAMIAGNKNPNFLYNPEQISKTAFIYADAMLKARGKVTD